MLFGEAIGILVAYFGELFCDWSWATTTAVITVTGMFSAMP